MEIRERNDHGSFIRVDRLKCAMLVTRQYSDAEVMVLPVRVR